MVKRKAAEEEPHEHEPRCEKCGYCKCCGQSRMDNTYRPYYPYWQYTPHYPTTTTTYPVIYRQGTTSTTARIQSS